MAHGLANTIPYARVLKDGSLKHERLTLPVAVRNMIHHPENPNNALSDDDLKQSVEMLLIVTKTEGI